MPESSQIVIIDDDRSSLLLLEYLFKSVGLGDQVKSVLGSEPGLRALENCAKGATCCPTLVILDVEMPRIDGFDLLTWIQENFCGSRPTTIMMSASQAAQHVRRAAELKADAYFVKFPPAATLREIYELAEKIRRGDQQARDQLVAHPASLRPSPS